LSVHGSDDVGLEVHRRQIDSVECQFLFLPREITGEQELAFFLLCFERNMSVLG